MFSIYKIINAKNGLAYIGSTCRPIRRRMSNHWSDARNGKDTLIAQAIRDFGPESFTVEIIERAETSDEMMEKEIAAINSHNAISPHGYNSSDGHGLWVPNRRQIESIREKISKSSMGKVISPEHRKKISETQKGRPAPNKGIKTGKPAWNRGIPASEECRAKLRAYHADVPSPNIRSIEFLGVTYPSIAEAARITGLSRTQMKYRLSTGKAKYTNAPEGGYQDPELPERRKEVCPQCGGPYSEVECGARFCRPCRSLKMMAAQRARRAAAKINKNP